MKKKAKVVPNTDEDKFALLGSCKNTHELISVQNLLVLFVSASSISEHRLLFEAKLHFTWWPRLSKAELGL
jgi:hypothetical protein